jgi:hypothetical protein
MRDDKPDQFVDELLDAALKRYGGEGPRAGLEMRVLAGVRSRQDAARRRRLVWALAACAGMAAAIVLVLHSARAPRREPLNSASAPRQVAKTAASPGSADSRVPSSRLVQGPRQKPRTPKPGARATQRPEKFPTPAPPTEQERLLMVFFNKGIKLDGVTQATTTGDVVTTDLKIPGVEIAPLEIKPIEESQSGQGK